MARFNEPRHDERGSEYNRRYGRYEGAFARRFATERYDMESAHRQGRGRHWTPRPADEEFIYEDRDYSRRYWPEDARRELRRGEPPVRRRERRRIGRRG